MEEKSANTSKTDSKPWLWKKGFCPNPSGRPKGKSLKAYTQEYLLKLTDEEKDEFLEGLPKEVIWKMGEGNAPQPLSNADGSNLQINVIKYGENNNSI